MPVLTRKYPTSVAASQTISHNTASPCRIPFLRTIMPILSSSGPLRQWVEHFPKKSLCQSFLMIFELDNLLIPLSFLSHLLPIFHQFSITLIPNRFPPICLPLVLLPRSFQTSARFDQITIRSTGWMAGFESIVWCKTADGMGTWW